MCSKKKLKTWWALLKHVSHCDTVHFIINQLQIRGPLHSSFVHHIQNIVSSSFGEDKAGYTIELHKKKIKTTHYDHLESYVTKLIGLFYTKYQYV